MRLGLQILQGFEVGVPAGLGHGSVERFPGRDSVHAAAGVAGGLTQQLCVLPQLGNLVLGSVALAQQLLGVQCNV